MNFITLYKICTLKFWYLIKHCNTIQETKTEENVGKIQILNCIAILYCSLHAGYTSGSTLLYMQAILLYSLPVSIMSGNEM